MKRKSQVFVWVILILIFFTQVSYGQTDDEAALDEEVALISQVYQILRDSHIYGGELSFPLRVISAVCGDLDIEFKSLDIQGRMMLVPTMLGAFYQPNPRHAYLFQELGVMRLMYRKIREMPKYKNEEHLELRVIRSIIKATKDEYTEYYTKDEYEELRASFDGVQTKLGVECRDHEDTWKIYHVLQNSPAYTAGLKAGDVISKVNQKKVDHIEELSKCTSEPLELEIKRGEQTYRKKVTPKPFATSTIKSCLFSPQVGYLSCQSFGKHTAKDFASHFEKLKEKEIHTLILDVRDNFGGYMSEVLPIVQQLIPSGTLMYQSHRYKGLKEVKISNGQEAGVKIILLMNECSASCAEILIAALRFHLEPCTIGTPSFGKNQGQDPFELINGGILKCTTCLSFTPSGDTYSKCGIEPEIYLENSAAQLVRGLLEAQVKPLSISLKDNLMYINGILRPEIFSYFTYRNGVYIERDMVEALVQAKVENNLFSYAMVPRLNVDQEWQFETYFELRNIQRTFPKLVFTKTDEELNLLVEE